MEPDTTTTSAASTMETAGKPIINLAGQVTANPVVSCRIEGVDGALLFNADKDSTLLINPTGIILWNFLGQPRTVKEIVEYVARSYTGCPDQATLRKDIETFVTDLAPDFISEV
jgi:hypothetical protein